MFFSLHLIDLIEDRVTEIACDDTLRPFFNAPEKASVIMRNIMTNAVVDEYKDKKLAFTDLTTLADRMKGMKSYSSEFIGTLTGWCIANFTTVESDETERPTKVIFTTQLLDPQKKEDALRVEADISRKNSLIAALSQEYDTVWYLDPTDQSLRLIGGTPEDSTGREIVASFKASNTDKAYMKDVRDFIASSVIPEDRELVLKEMDIDFLMNTVEIGKPH